MGSARLVAQVTTPIQTNPRCCEQSSRVAVSRSGTVASPPAMAWRRSRNSAIDTGPSWHVAPREATRPPCVPTSVAGKRASRLCQN
jgi:hypothetical protein